MKALSIIITLACLLFSASANAQQTLDMRSFKNIPVIDQGRIKPLSSFAVSTLKQISGQDKIGKMSATEWLAFTIFDPQNAAQFAVISIEKPEIIAKLNLQKKKFYSYAEIRPGLDQTIPDIQAILQKPEPSPSEYALLAVHEKAAQIDQLMRSFSAYLPLNIPLPKVFQDHIDGPTNYVQLRKIENAINDTVKNIIAQKGPDPAKYLPEELAIAKAAFHIQAMHVGGETNTLLRIIPTQPQAGETQWQTPWQILLTEQDSPATEFVLSQWLDLANAFRSQNTDSWAAASAELLTETLTQGGDQASLMHFQAEQFYTGAKLYIWVLVFYILAIISIFAKNIKPALKPKLPILYAALGITVHIAALALRIYILDRPPVGTLYESILFVSLICAAAGLRVSLARKSPLSLAAGLIAAITLLFAAPIFQTQADSLEVLVAVLNTNFWLSTHVLIITAGYGISLFAACTAHAALYLKAKNGAPKTWIILQQNTYHLSLAALLFTAVGTILGGIWADQSWGRFWGWDPKENGALLIVLWLIWAQHGRHAQKLGPDAFLAVIAALNIIVALSWFGVNLLSVGLHSYGFTTGLAGGLATFCALQLGAIIWLYTTAKKKAA